MLKSLYSDRKSLLGDQCFRNFVFRVLDSFGFYIMGKKKVKNFIPEEMNIVENLSSSTQRLKVF